MKPFKSLKRKQRKQKIRKSKSKSCSTKTKHQHKRSNAINNNKEDSYCEKLEKIINDYAPCGKIRKQYYDEMYKWLDEKCKEEELNEAVEKYKAITNSYWF